MTKNNQNVPPAVSLEDWRDICDTLHGDQEAFSRIVHRYQQKLAGTLWKFTKNREDLEELVHDTLIEVYQNLSKFRGDSPLFPWMKTIAVRTGYRYWKNNRNKALNFSSTFEPSVSDPVYSDAEIYLTEALERLPPREKLILIMHYFEGWDFQEIARKMNWSYTLVRVCAWRARNILKSKLKAAGFGGNHEN